MKQRLKDRFRAPSFSIGAMHIAVLFSLSLSQPLFNLISKNTAFLVARQSEPIDIVTLIVLLVAIVPLAFIGIEGLAQIIHRHVRLGIHFFLVAGLTAALALQAVKPVFADQGHVVMAGAALAGIGISVAYHRYPSIRLFVTILSPSILIFPILFIFNSPVHKFLLANQAPEANLKSPVAIHDGPPIVMVVLDELPATSLMNSQNRIDSSRYPNFASLARDAYWFRNATTVSTTTADAVPAILSGLYPKRPRLPNVDGYPNNLFTLLGGAYTIKADEPVTRLCPRNLCKPQIDPFGNRMQSLLMDLSVVYLHILLPRDLATALPVVDQTWKNFAVSSKGGGVQGNDWTLIKKTKDRKRTLLEIIHTEMRRDRSEAFRRFIESIEATETPTLYFVHSYLPHTPWVYLPSGKKYVLPGYRLKGLTEKKWDDAFSGAMAFQHHLLQVSFVDTLIGELIDKLKQEGLYDRALIVLTADHGISFRAGDIRRGLTLTNYGDIMPVPLFIKLPGQREGIVDDRNVESIDILPTIADVLNLTLPWSIDGWSALDATRPERGKKVIYTVFRNTPEEKYVFGPGGDAKYTTLKRKLRLFGESPDPAGLYTIGPYGSLFGKRVDPGGPAAAPGLTVSIDNEDLYDNVSLTGSFIPAHITGKLDPGGGPQNRTIAVAVNGVIRSVTRTLVDPIGETVFSAVVPESSFRSGSNRIAVFIADETGSEVVLSRVFRKRMAVFSLSFPDRLTSSSGEVIRVALQPRRIDDGTEIEGRQIFSVAPEVSAISSIAAAICELTSWQLCATSRHMSCSQ